VEDNRTANAPETDEKKSRGLGSYVLWAFVAVMVYVLSIGPVVYLGWKGKLNNTPGMNRLLGHFYGPLFYAYDHTPLHKPLGLYLHLWVPRQWDEKGEFRHH
jgi:hypothetical protein